MDQNHITHIIRVRFLQVQVLTQDQAHILIIHTLDSKRKAGKKISEGPVRDLLFFLYPP
jgi:hypothetical protein